MYVVQAIQVLENLVLPRLIGGLQKLDFPPFPVFFKLSHTPEVAFNHTFELLINTTMLV